MADLVAVMGREGEEGGEEGEEGGEEEEEEEGERGTVGSSEVEEEKARGVILEERGPWRGWEQGEGGGVS